MRIRIRWVFITILITMLATPLVFVQSRYFAKWLTKFAKENILKDVGVEGGFQELSVQIFPPGILVQEPKVVLQENNPIGLPLGTKLEAKHIEVTFDMVQLITGIVSINGVVIHGANLNVQFTKEFFELLEKRQHNKKRSFFSAKKQKA